MQFSAKNLTNIVSGDGIATAPSDSTMIFLVGFKGDQNSMDYGLRVGYLHAHFSL
jgi:hypothetical protein